MNATVMFPSWLERVAKSKLGTIEIGGLITHIARQHLGFDGEGYEPMTEVIPYLDKDYLISRHGWLREKKKKLPWKVSSKRWVNIPNDGLLVITHLEADYSAERPDPPSYMITQELACDWRP